MILWCVGCGSAIRVTGNPAETRALFDGKDTWPCFQEGCEHPLRQGLETEVDQKALRLMEVIELTPKEAFAAVHGLGLPKERAVCDEVLEPLFKAHGIKLHGRQPRSNTRYYVDSLEMPDGTQIHFASSTQGAVIYRITKPHSYTKEALDVG